MSSIISGDCDCLTRASSSRGFSIGEAFLANVLETKFKPGLCTFSRRKLPDVVYPQRASACKMSKIAIICQKIAILAIVKFGSSASRRA
jgi:hypothetical protein